MKKFFAIAAMAAMLIACGDKENDDKKPGNGGEPEEPEFVSAITIDGQFGDWAALDASKVVEATLPEGETKHGDLKKVKIYADDLYINVYFEAAEPEADMPYHIDLCINIDNDEMTGGYANVWSNAGVDYLIEGCVYNENPDRDQTDQSQENQCNIDEDRLDQNLRLEAGGVFTGICSLFAHNPNPPPLAILRLYSFIAAFLFF